MNMHMPHDRDRTIGRPIRIGLVGAGAAAEGIHLPALARIADALVVAIADPVRARAEHLQAAFGIPAVYADYRGMIPHVDAAIVAVPHHLHAPVAIDLLDAGIDVLVEKPMAPTTAECDDMIAASNRSGAILAVGLLRRFAPTLRWTSDALAAGLLGRVESFDIREGLVFRWPIRSAAWFHPRDGGVFADIGTHIVDLLLWWFGDVSAIDYRDDAVGGVEADAVADVRMANGVTGRVELSRSRELRNTCIIRGERGTIEVGTKTDSTIVLTPAGSHTAVAGRAAIANQQTPTCLADLFAAQMVDLLRAVRGDRTPAVSGREARRTVAVLEACYRNRRPLVYPFESVLYNADTAAKAS